MEPRSLVPKSYVALTRNSAVQHSPILPTDERRCGSTHCSVVGALLHSRQNGNRAIHHSQSRNDDTGNCQALAPLPRFADLIQADDGKDQAENTKKE